MRVSIIPVDNVVVIDGRAAHFDLSVYDQLRNVHAVQWDTDTEVCTVERRGNAPIIIKTLAPFQDVFLAAQLKLMEPPPPEPVPARIDVIPGEYLRALLMRDQQLANDLETEYIGLLQTAPAVPGTTKEETAS